MPLRCYPPWNSLESDGSPLGSTLPHLPWYNTRPLGFHLPRCLCLKDIFIPPGIVRVFQRTVSIPPHGFHVSGRIQLHQVLFIPSGIVCVFSENSFHTASRFSRLRTNSATPGIIHTIRYCVCVFREQFPYRLTVSRLRTNSATPGLSFSVFFFYIYFGESTYFSETISSFK